MADDITDAEETGGPSSTTSAAAPSTAPEKPPAGSKLDPNKLVKTVKSTKYVADDSKSWTLYPSSASGHSKEVAVETDVYQDGHTISYIMDGSGKRYADAAATGTDPAQRGEWDNKVKDAKALEEKPRKPVRSYTGEDPKTHKPAKITEYDSGEPTYEEITPPARSTSQVAAPSNQQFIVEDDGKGNLTQHPNPNYTGPEPKKGTTQFIKSGGKTFAVPIDADGKAGQPYDTGIPDDAKPDTYSTPDGLVQVDKDGNARLVYAKPKDPNVKIEKDPKTGRWIEIRVNPDGTSSVREVKPEGVTPAKKPDMGPPPAPDKVVEWLYGEQAKIDQAVRSGDLTEEEATTEMANRHKFAESMVAQYNAQQQRADKTNERTQQAGQDESANYRAGLSAGSSIFTSVAPGAMSMGSKLLPGNGMVAARGLMALVQLGQQMAQQVAGPRPVTTVSPDGTVRVDHTGGAPAATSGPVTPAPNNADLASQIAASSQTELAQPGDPGGPDAAGQPQIFGANPGEGAMGEMIQKPAPAFLPPPPDPNSPTPVGQGQDNASVAAMLTAPGGAPSWATAQSTAAPVAPEQPPRTSLGDAMGGLMGSDPSWANAWEEASRRNAMEQAA